MWILLKQETVSGSGISWAICKYAPCTRQITTPALHHSVFHRPDALPATQSTASKHWRHMLCRPYTQTKPFIWLYTCTMAITQVNLVSGCHLNSVDDLCMPGCPYWNDSQDLSSSSSTTDSLAKKHCSLFSGSLMPVPKHTTCNKHHCHHSQLSLLQFIMHIISQNLISAQTPSKPTAGPTPPVV